MKSAIQQINNRIAEACRRSGRSRDEVRLVAVTKTVPVPVILQAYQLGIQAFAENRAQDFREKAPALPADIEWHFIGHLQTNKIKYVAPRTQLIHSVDSWHLAQALAEYAKQNQVSCPVLLQVNTTGEESKSGVPPEEALDLFGEIQRLSALRLKGLMTIGPFTDDEKQIRQAFRRLVKIQEQLLKFVTAEAISILSMGMSHDFEIAIEEGSTMVRIGSAIFGPRGR